MRIPKVLEKKIVSRYPLEGGVRIAEEEGLPNKTVGRMANKLGITTEDRKDTLVCRKCNINKSIDEFSKGNRKCRRCLAQDKVDRANKRRGEKVSVISQICSKCNKELPADSFSSNLLNKNRINTKCRGCCKLYNRLSRYGIKEEEYKKILKKQNNLCEICKEVLEVPYLDHDHRSGKIRGLLCMNCNSGLGQFKDSSNVVFRAASYLYSHEEHWCPQ